MNQQPVQFAVIGCGALARATHLPHIVASPRMRLHTCCDVSEESMKFCADTYRPVRTTKDYKAAVRDPEVHAICVATTEKMRLPVIEEAAAVKKPVYCEKPVAATLKEMYQIQRIIHQSGIPFCVGHNRRSSPAMIAAQKIFRQHIEHPQPCPWRWDRDGGQRPRLSEDGAPGVAVRINDDWHSWKAWIFDENKSSLTPFVFEMTHFTDICNWFLGRDAEEVVAMEAGWLNHSVIIRYAGQSLATISLSDNGTFGYPKELYEFMGNGGIVVVDHMLEVRTAGIGGAPARQTFPMKNDRHPHVGTEGGLYGWLAKKRAACEEAAAAGDPLKQFTAEPNKGHAEMLERFVAQFCENGPVVCGIDDAVKATEIGFAAHLAAREHRVVKIAEVRSQR